MSENTDRNGSSHTPGPWRVGKGGPNGCPTVGTERGLLLCMLGHTVNIPSQAQIATANARLMAAAPDMLEALMLAEEWLEIDPVAEERGVVETIRAAILKATAHHPTSPEREPSA